MRIITPPSHAPAHIAHRCSARAHMVLPLKNLRMKTFVAGSVTCSCEYSSVCLPTSDEICRCVQRIYSLPVQLLLPLLVGG